MPPHLSSDNPPWARFCGRAHEYAAFRPHYPTGLIDALVQRFGRDEKLPVADIGMGTGIFARVLLARGFAVYGVEPNAEMRALAQETLAHFPAFRAVAGSAERTTLPDASVHFITAAHSFHWFAIEPTRVEFRRISRPPHTVAILWNERLTATHPFAASYDALLWKYGVGYAETLGKQQAQESRLPYFYAAPYEHLTAEHTQILSWDALQGLALSYSFLPRPPHSHFVPFFEELRNLFDKYAENNVVTLIYRAHLFIGNLGER